MEKKSVQGKAESKRWKREATLRDILDALNEIRDCDKSEEEKAQLRQRVIDYGQYLAKEIYEGRKEVPESDDNKTIKEFNLRMLQSYYVKGKSKYEEAKAPNWYFEKKKFIKNEGEFVNSGVRNDTNPRWRPIPLKEEEMVIVPPVVAKRDSVLPWLLPLIPLVFANKCGDTGEIMPVEPVKPKVDEVVVDTLRASEKSYLRYTVEKGQRMVAHQFGIENGEYIYNNFVSNADKMPNEFKELLDKYNMSSMVDEGLDVNLKNRNEIMATTMLLMSETYPNIKNIILNQFEHPGMPVSKIELDKVEKRLKLANLAHQRYGGNEESNLVSDIDYGVFGADKETGWCVDFMKESKKLESGKMGSDKEFYNEVVKNAFEKGGNDRY